MNAFYVVMIKLPYKQKHNRILKCHVLIDLKLGKLTHQDVRQMDSYIRMFDDLYKHTDDNPTLGLILCSEKNVAVVQY